MPQISIDGVIYNPSYDAMGNDDRLQEASNTDEIGLSPELFRLEFTLSSEGIATYVKGMFSYLCTPTYL